MGHATELYLLYQDPEWLLNTTNTLQYHSSKFIWLEVKVRTPHFKTRQTFILCVLHYFWSHRMVSKLIKMAFNLSSLQLYHQKYWNICYCNFYVFLDTIFTGLHLFLFTQTKAKRVRTVDQILSYL